MRTLARAGALAALLLLGGAGCDYGLEADGSSEPGIQAAALGSSESDPLSISASGEEPSTVPNGSPADPTSPGSTTSTPPAGGSPDPDPSQTQGIVPVAAAFLAPSSRPASGDCIDFTTGSARLVPCTMFRNTVNPIGHDDPDPWRPTAGPTKPF